VLACHAEAERRRVTGHLSLVIFYDRMKKTMDEICSNRF
jgi:hypothetical protein